MVRHLIRAEALRCVVATWRRRRFRTAVVCGLLVYFTAIGGAQVPQTPPDPIGTPLDSMLREIAESSYLSATDIGYQAIEELQRAYCAKDPICAESQRDCVLRMTSLTSAVFKQAPRVEVMKYVCRRVSTRYEHPGSYFLLSAKLARVNGAATSLGLSPATNARIGSALMGKVNASAYPKSRPDIQLILVDVRYLDFVHELTKTVVNALPFRPVPNGGIVLEAGPEALKRRLEADVSLIKNFRFRLEQYLGIEKGDYYIPPTDLSTAVTLAYDDGMELFAVAHEVGHSLNGHTSVRNLEADDFTVPPTNSTITLNAGGWAEEVEADLTGLRIVSREFSTAAASDDWAQLIKPFAVEYYFALRTIMQKAQSGWLSKTNATTSPSLEQGAFEALLPCVDAVDCDVTEFVAKQLTPLSHVSSHPSYDFRQRLVRHVLRLDERERQSPQTAQLAVAIREAAIRIWSNIEEAGQKR